MEVDKSNPTIWYAGGYAANVGVYKSTNTGETWTQLTSGLPTTGTYRTAIAIAESSPSTLYALYCNNSDYGLYGVYKTTNGGSSWTQSTGSSPNMLGWNTNGGDSGGQGWYDLVIAVAPTNPNIVYVGGVNIWESNNGGSSWAAASYWVTGNTVPYVHADHHALEFLPGSSTTLFSGNDGGLFKTTNNATSWSDLSNGLGIHQFYRMGGSAQNANIVYGGAQDNGTDRYNNGTWTRVIGGDGMEALVDYSNSNVAYGELYYGDMRRTTNGGSSFTSINSDVTEDGDWVAPFVIHPTTPNTLFRATTKVYRTTNQGTNWTAISAVLGEASNALTTLAVAPSNPNYIYTSRPGFRTGTTPGFYRTTNGGTSWTTLTNAPTGVTYIAVHPTDPNTLWATKSGYTAGAKVYKSTDAGNTWQNVSGQLPNIPVNCVVVHPNAANDVYVGTDLGTFFSSTGGDNWVEFNTGLPNVIVNELEIHVASSKIRAATYGRGLW